MKQIAYVFLTVFLSQNVFAAGVGKYLSIKTDVPEQRSGDGRSSDVPNPNNLINIQVCASGFEDWKSIISSLCNLNQPIPGMGGVTAYGVPSGTCYAASCDGLPIERVLYQTTCVRRFKGTPK